MDNIIWYFFLGMFVSFLGSIPVGAINLNVIRTSLDSGIRPALFFSLGSTLVELIYSLIAIESIDFIPDLQAFVPILNLAAIPFFIILGINTWKSNPGKNKIKSIDKRSFYSGIFVSLINPLQIPFWIIWNSYFLENGWIIKNLFLLHFYVLGTGIGAFIFLALLSFIISKYRSDASRKLLWMNKGMAIAFVLLGCFQAVKLLII